MAGGAVNDGGADARAPNTGWVVDSAVAGAGAGAAAGSYIGCNQQRGRAEAVSAGGAYRATSNLRIRSGPGTNYGVRGTLRAGQPFSAIGSQGEWVQIAGGGWVNANYVAAN